MNTKMDDIEMIEEAIRLEYNKVIDPNLDEKAHDTAIMNMLKLAEQKSKLVEAEREFAKASEKYAMEEREFKLKEDEFEERKESAAREAERNAQNDATDKKFKEDTLRQQRLATYFGTATALLTFTIGAVVKCTLFNKGLTFEQTGTVRSLFVRNECDLKNLMK